MEPWGCCRAAHSARSRLGKSGLRVMTLGKQLGAVEQKSDQSEHIKPHRRTNGESSNKRLIYNSTVGTYHPSPLARAIRNNPAPRARAPVARATRSPAGARRSTVMAAMTTAIARRSITPMTRRIAVGPAQQ
jgi:hypothetical protein